MKAIRIFLLVLIIIGIGLICTQKLWVTPLVNKILASEQPVQKPSQAQALAVTQTQYASEATAATTTDASGNFLTCINWPNYFVISREMADYDAGNDILVKYKTNPTESFSCEYNVTANDFEIKNQDSMDQADYIMGIANNFLIVDDGTYTVNDFYVYDLTTRKKIYTDKSYGDETLHGNILSYLTYVSEATLQNCPELAQYRAQAGTNALDGAIEQLVDLDVTTLVKTDSGPPQCVPIE